MLVTTEKNRVKTRTYAGWLVLVFVTSRAAAYIAGVRFDVSPLHTELQFADPLFLQHRLMETAYYLHSQPPLFNFLAGIILKIFSQNSGLAFHAIFLCCGLAIGLVLFRLMVRMQVSVKLALAITAIFMVGPAAILYENWFFYALPVSLGLAASALLLHRFISTGRRTDAVLFFFSLAIICLIRSFYHVAWLLAIVAVLWVTNREHRRTILIAACLPVLVVLGIYIKNATEFGSFTASTWLGLSMLRITADRLTLEERARLIDEHKISPLSNLDLRGSVDSIEAVVGTPAPTGIPVLDQRVKSTGYPNWNSMVYLRASELARGDVSYVIHHYPWKYAGGVASAAALFCSPADDIADVIPNRQKIAGYANTYNAIFTGQFIPHAELTPQEWKSQGTVRKTFSQGLWLLIAVPALLVFGIVRSFLLLRDRATRNDPITLTLAFMTGCVIYVMATTSLVEIRANNRFRFDVDPFLLAIGGVALTTTLDRRRRIAKRVAKATASA